MKTLKKDQGLVPTYAARAATDFHLTELQTTEYLAGNVNWSAGEPSSASKESQPALIYTLI